MDVSVLLDSLCDIDGYRVIVSRVNVAEPVQLTDVVYIAALTLTVNDDGCGFDTQSSASHGMGLQNIRDRIAHYRGTMDIDSDTTHGTEVNVTLPI